MKRHKNHNINTQNLQESIRWTYRSNGSLFKEDSYVCSCCNGRWSAILNPYFKIRYHWPVSADYGRLGKDLWTHVNGPGSYVWFPDSITAIFSQNSITGTTTHHRNTGRYRHVAATTPLLLQRHRPAYCFWHILYVHKNVFPLLRVVYSY